VLQPGPHREDGGTFVVFEIKFTGAFPGWVEDIVRRFELEPRSVPKYALSIDELFRARSERALVAAGFRVPRRAG
jgi:hypothetical protein